jgi:hypothetical protein
LLLQIHHLSFAPNNATTLRFRLCSSALARLQKDNAFCGFASLCMLICTLHMNSLFKYNLKYYLFSSTFATRNLLCCVPPRRARGAHTSRHTTMKEEDATFTAVARRQYETRVANFSHKELKCTKCWLLKEVCVCNQVAPVTTKHECI